MGARVRATTSGMAAHASHDPLVPLADAKAYVLDRIHRAEPARVPLAAARGLVLAEQIAALDSVPPFANTAVDGFAVQAADLSAATDATPVTLRVVGTIAAGAPPSIPVGRGEAVRIMTGAPMPAGADAVVMVELTDGWTGNDTVSVRASVAVGAHIRGAGDDVVVGMVVFEPGELLTPGHLGVLASLGYLDVLASPRPRVGVLSTGDELIEGPQTLEPGQIRDSNRVTLLALVEEMGCEGVDLGIARDTEADITTAIERGVKECDALLTSGGVSMGAFDYVKVVLDRIGTMRWMQVAIKPAKPFAFGTVSVPTAPTAISEPDAVVVVSMVPVFGLPGNPVSSMVSFELFARPALRKMMGVPQAQWERPTVRAITDEPIRGHDDGKVHFNRVLTVLSHDGRVHVRTSGGQGSHHLLAMARADALAVIPVGPAIDAGGEVDVLVLR
jgi:molybdopterin molybdotransferase